MFSPPTRKSGLSARKNVSVTNYDSPIAVAENRRPPHDSPIPNRPATGTPAPWASRLSVLARIPTLNKSEKGEPKYVAEFPQVLRDAQTMLLQNHAPGDASISGGIDKETSLAWIVCVKRLFVWNYLSPASSRECVVLDLPSITSENGDSGKNLFHSNNWLVCIVNRDSAKRSSGKAVQQCNSAGVIMCNKKTQMLIYWPDIYTVAKNKPVIGVVSVEESEGSYFPRDGKAIPSKQRQQGRPSSLNRSTSINSMIAAAIPGNSHDCIALACSSCGELWQFFCGPSSVQSNQVCVGTLDISSQSSDTCPFVASKGYPRSLIWHSYRPSDERKRQFLFLTDHDIQCFTIELSRDFNVSKLWSHQIIGTDGDLGIQKDLAGQKRIWPLELQVDSDGKVITILIAIFCKDRATSSSYTEYSLLTMQYKSGVDITKPIGERILEKKAPNQVIIPKARVEDEEFLFSMRLKVGGKPAGSAIILSADGTATVSYYWRNSTRLYQFDLPYDAGKVLDASVLSALEDSDDGAWAVLTEKAGVWAIPESAILHGGVEPPERSLSRKGSSNDRSTLEERRNLSLAGNIAPRRASSEAWDVGDRQRAGLTGIARRSPQDEESEALLTQLFHNFLLSGQVDGVFDKLENSRAFEREGEINVFTRTSKSIVDALAKHWTTTRGPEIISLSAVSTQLVEKQQKHQQYLQFLALSKCHEELCSRQRQAMQIIMEHGEKLAGMIKVRELQHIINQSHATGVEAASGSHTQISGALWDLIQLVGERARRNTVLLMDRDSAEVFYSKVSDIEELFYCLDRQLEYLINGEMPIAIQFRRACELSNACVTLFSASMQYRSEHHLWYPPSEGLTPWYSKTVVLGGLWSVASFMLQLLNEMSHLDDSAKLEFCSHLELLSEVMLDAYSSAVTAKIDRKEEQRSLLAEYWKRRDELLGSLYQQVNKFVEAKLQDSVEENEEQHNDIIRKLSARVLSVAKRHEAYQTMWSICHDLNDSELLRSLMHESVGPKGGFSYFVFEQLYESKHFSKLMRLGEEFPEDLDIFLKHHPHLLWLHELFLHQFSSASDTLHALSLSKEDILISVTDETDAGGSNSRLTLADRKHFLNLAKISAMAGNNADYDAKVKRIEADLNILKLQEEILKLVPDGEEKQSMEQKLLPPLDLIELCIKSQNRELSLRAFDLFAWTSSSFTRSNTSLLEECWRNAANQDDWENLYQMSLTEGWGDEETFDVLRGTVIFQVSSKCHGPESATFGGIFDEVLPLRQDNSEISTKKDTTSSVETILMQHKDFPDAGKLMISAIMLGSVPVMAGSTDDEGPSLMDS